MSEYQISMEEIERDSSSFLERVKAGESLIILKNGEPFAKVKPVKSRKREKRPYGLCQGDFIVPDDFDDPLPEDMI